jgi:hypothetical protein
MKDASFLERLAEDLLEGTFAFAFKSRLEPVQIAKSLVREMERNRVVGPEAPLVPNHYVAHLHPGDFDAVSEFRQGLERELENYLRGYATMRGFRSLGNISVNVARADPPGKRLRVKVTASMVDTPPREVQARPAHPTQVTAEMPRAEATLREALSRVPAGLEAAEGSLISLASEVTSIGRSIDSDIVIESAGVSRHHAQIVWEQDHYVVVDLESTNGTFVSGSRVTRLELSGDEEISFGEAQFTFRLLADNESIRAQGAKGAGD